MELPSTTHEEDTDSRQECAVCGGWTSSGRQLCQACDQGLTSRQYADLFWDEV
jgi:hypothetical protein